MLLLLVRRHGSLCAPAAGGATACMWARETEQARVVAAHVWARVASGAGWVWSEGATYVRRGRGSTVRR
jgi:hypothetical protein